jgi:hypothetical protein
MMRWSIHVAYVGEIRSAYIILVRTAEEEALERLHIDGV